jgi:hypothetical protein
VLGAGRGPLVNAAMRASITTGRKLQVAEMFWMWNWFWFWFRFGFGFVFVSLSVLVSASVFGLVLFLWNLVEFLSLILQLYALEKNPNAVNTLMNLKRSHPDWKHVTVISTDIRAWHASIKADVIVSELLGSFGDNELSPECLYGAQDILKGTTKKNVVGGESACDCSLRSLLLFFVPVLFSLHAVYLPCRGRYQHSSQLHVLCGSVVLHQALQ